MIGVGNFEPSEEMCGVRRAVRSGHLAGRLSFAVVSVGGLVQSHNFVGKVCFKILHG